MDLHQLGQFEQIAMPTSSFSKLPTHVDDLSTDQHYAYRICWAIINGAIEHDLVYLEVGPIVHLRWLTLGCNILHYYVSLNKPPPTIKLLVLLLNGVFTNLFEIKLHHQITHGS